MIKNQKDGKREAAITGSFPCEKIKIGMNALKINKINIFLFLFLLVIFSIFQYGIYKICGFALYPDEFGYWASAANIVGYNWSEVASMGSYYSFGYSLILIPILKLFTNGVRAYRAAVAVNMLLMCASVFLLQRIGRKLFPDIDELKSVFISGIAVLYPSWIFYMQMTMAEALLFFLFVLVTYLLLSYIDNPKAITAVLLAICFIYTYCVHMRTVGIVIACVCTCFLWGIVKSGKKEYIKSIFVLIIVLAVAVWIVQELKSRTVSEVFSYAEAKVLEGNDYGSQWNKLVEIFTFSGMIRLLNGVLGKIFYLGLASFGVFYWAFGWCVKESFGLATGIVKKRETILRQWGALFLLLSAVGEILISSIYMYSPSRVDCLIYGRYDELVIPVMMLVGIAVMERNRFLLPVTLLLGLLSGGMAIKLLDVVEAEGLKGLRGYHIAGISYLINEDNLNIYIFFRDTWLLGFGLMIAVSVLLWLSRHLKAGAWIFTIIFLVEIKAGLQISEHYTYRMNNANFENQRVAEVIRKEDMGESRIVYLDEGIPAYIGFVQMQLPEKTIHVIKEEDLGKADNLGTFMITCTETKQNDKLQKIYNKKIEANTFYLYFNQDT